MADLVSYPGKLGHYIAADKALIAAKNLSIMYSINMMVNWDKLVCFLWATWKGYNMEPVTLQEFATRNQIPGELVHRFIRKLQYVGWESICGFRKEET